MRNPKQPRNVADRGRDGKKSARLTPKANGPSVATKRRRTGGRVFVFHKEDLGQAGDGGQLGQEGLAGARPSAQAGAGRARGAEHSWAAARRGTASGGDESRACASRTT